MGQEQSYQKDCLNITTMNEKQFEKKFDKQKLLTEGGFGKIYIAQDIEKKKLVAIKCLPNKGQTEDFQKNIQRELLLMETDHDNIIKCEAVYRVNKKVENDYEYLLILELGENNLKEFLDEHKSWITFENKYTDLGIAKVLDDNATVTNLYYNKFWPLEMQDSQEKINQKNVDIYSLGGVILFLLACDQNINTKDYKEYQKKYMWEMEGFIKKFNINQYLEKIIINMLQKQNEKRPNIQQILTDFNSLIDEGKIGIKNPYAKKIRQYVDFQQFLMEFGVDQNQLNLQNNNNIFKKLNDIEDLRIYCEQGSNIENQNICIGVTKIEKNTKKVLIQEMVKAFQNAENNICNIKKLSLIFNSTFKDSLSKDQIWKLKDLFNMKFFEKLEFFRMLFFPLSLNKIAKISIFISTVIQLIQCEYDTTNLEKQQVNQITDKIKKQDFTLDTEYIWSFDSAQIGPDCYGLILRSNNPVPFINNGQMMILFVDSQGNQISNKTLKVGYRQQYSITHTNVEDEALIAYTNNQILYVIFMNKYAEYTRGMNQPYEMGDFLLGVLAKTGTNFIYIISQEYDYSGFQNNSPQQLLCFTIDIEDTNNFSIFSDFHLTLDKFYLYLFTLQVYENDMAVVISQNDSNIEQYLVFGVVDKNLMWIKVDDDDDDNKQSVILFADPINCELYQNSQGGSFSIQGIKQGFVFHTYDENKILRIFGMSSQIGTSNSVSFEAYEIQFGCQNTEYYDQNLGCLECNFPCQTCENQYICLSCVSDDTRDLNDNCLCKSSYYENGNIECMECHINCLQCLDSDTCTECVDPITQDQNNKCACKIGYYLDSDNQCQSCNQNCTKCTGNDTCTDCIGDNRNLSQQCQCYEGYYEDQNKLCQAYKQCTYSQIYCENCFNNGTCAECQYDFLDKLNDCQSCIDGELYFNTDTLICEQKEQDNTNTLDCIGLFKTKDTCQCLEGYYIDEELEQQNQQNCQKCSPQCANCANKDLCTKCVNPNFKPPFCKSDGNKSVTIVKPDGQLIETSCRFQCEQCEENSPASCTSCIQGENRDVNGNCKCLPGYHDQNSTQKNCQKCPVQCEECISSDFCTKCNIQQKLAYNSKTNICDCIRGYKWNNFEKMCKQCYYFQGECYENCPQNTIKNDKYKICQIVEYKIISIQFYYKVGGMVCFFMILCTVLIILFVKQVEKEIGLDNDKLRNLRKIENEQQWELREDLVLEYIKEKYYKYIDIDKIPIVLIIYKLVNGKVHVTSKVKLYENQSQNSQNDIDNIYTIVSKYENNNLLQPMKKQKIID
ncbi:Protein kinase-like domain [Pseudocohnilembus persalinus]|uniref:Protein kinase-like domain n=1 Tax=Pseudocohnilembus persalinus TaxID=266149 RepID=A0A0V0R6C7_PSEPJ|nr:Protein kinase-like domain [Pseudocohnilembus persalinus]|eukprot:KRX09781.1 Protein kinase-like domain [Pseudocohnilembus persalinus]